MRLWNRSKAGGNGDRPRKWRHGFSMSMTQAPKMAAAIGTRVPRGAVASAAAQAARPTTPSTLPTCTNSSQSNRSSPQWGMVSITRCEATPATRAGSGRRTTSPIATPARA